MSRLLTVGNPPIQVKLRRSARARRLSLRISQSNGSVTLTLPVRVPEEQGIAFLAEKEDWLRRHLANVSGATSIARGVEIPFRGDMVMIGAGSGRSVTLIGDVIAVPGADDKVGVRTKAFLKATARDHLAAASDRFAGALGRSVGKITLRDTRSRWGSCTSRGDLMYSWRLIMAPPEVLEYVAAHECAHLIEMNHSQAFWDVVSRIYPDYKLCRDWLREHGTKLHQYDFGD